MSTPPPNSKFDFTYSVFILISHIYASFKWNYGSTTTIGLECNIKPHMVFFFPPKINMDKNRSHAQLIVCIHKCSMAYTSKKKNKCMPWGLNVDSKLHEVKYFNFLFSILYGLKKNFLWKNHMDFFSLYILYSTTCMVETNSILIIFRAKIWFWTEGGKIYN